MNLSQTINIYSSIIIAISTLSYALFTFFTIRLLIKQNKLLAQDSFNKLSSNLYEKYTTPYYIKIITKLKNYSSHHLIKTFPSKLKNPTPEKIEIFNKIKNTELLKSYELDKLIEMILTFNDLIKKNILDTYTILLTFKNFFGYDEDSCNENYNIIVNCLNSIYKSKKNEKIKIINEFFSNIAKNRFYRKLEQSIQKNIIQ